ncbi:MAG TPA: c-type cytochrome [Polyangiaceae bacterium]|nr:c-type cytochrome [Polyangiaceae bacterium]
MARGQEIYQLCSQCHGPLGQGNESLQAPAIAGQHAWYVAAQLQKFKQGIRGKHPDDAAGLRMRPMALALKSDADIAAVADYVASLPVTPPSRTLPSGSAEKGKALYTACATCHGPDGAGNAEMKAPALVRTNDWYLLSQLHKFKGRVRGASPEDAEAALMLPWAMSLTDEQAMKDVLAYVGTLR